MTKLLYIPFIFLIGCAAPKVHKTGTIFAPSVLTVKSDIQKAQNSISSAAESNNRLTENLNKTYNYSSRIDAKSAVILKHWSKARERENLSR